MEYTYTLVRNPKWSNLEHTALDCEVNFDHLPEEFAPFTAVASGDYPHTHQIFAECVAGMWGEIAEYSLEDLAKAERHRRNIRLQYVDQIVSNPLRWASLASEKQAEWATYRQALLDVPQQEGFPTSIVWPTKPEV